MKSTLTCPYCQGQMNATGRGALPDSQRYICLSCPPGQQYKELLSAVVARTGNQGFGFVSVQDLPRAGQMYFTHADVHGPLPQVGDRVLLLLANGPRGQYARAVYTQPQSRPGVRPRPRPQPRPQPTPLPPPVARRWGVITAVKGPDWGFLQDMESGQDVFVHLSQCRGHGALNQGQRVVYTPGRTHRGPCALDVQAA